MLMPSIFGENLFDDDWMDLPFEREFRGRKNPLYGKNAKNIMKTDIREHDESYELDIDLPGFKEDVKAKFGEGILRLGIPKKDAKAAETKKAIAIEG